MEKDYSLLRLFDLEKAKAGEALIDGDGDLCTFIDGPHHITEEIVARYDGNAGFYVADSDFYRMAPLCWVEGKPVYKGDVLWHKEGLRGVAGSFDGEQLLCDWDIWPGDKPCGARPGNLTWTPPAKPKVKKEGWVNVYPGYRGGKTIYGSEDIANSMASTDRLACIRIEWEE